MDLLKLKATLGLDSKEYEDGLRDAEHKAGGLGSKLAGGLGKAAKVGVAAVGAASAAVGVLVKKSVDSYAQYQQMVGGVQKLYGNMGMSLEDYAASVGKSVDQVRGEWQKMEEAQNLVLENAKNAYKTTGMSANTYMEMATSFSASLITSLGGDTKKAAEQTDVAMRAISDNFNTFGGDIGMIQGAFQGFAKQNYTMLDNLKLGYGGTKHEMERLIADANEWAEANGKAADLSMDSFSDIVTAIDYIQQKQHIAGTTAREAGSTIEGSFMSVKAAWDNLVTGFADPDADIAELMSNLTTAAATAAKNIIPAITQAISGVGDALVQIIPQLIEGLPKAFDEVTVPLVSTGVKVVKTIIRGLMDNLPQALEGLLPLLKEIFDNVVEGIDTYLPMILNKGIEILKSLTDGLRENIDTILDAGANLLLHIVKGIASAIPTLIEYAPQIIANLVVVLVKALPRIIDLGIKIIAALIEGIFKAIPKLPKACADAIETIKNSFANVNWSGVGRNILEGIASGIFGGAGLIIKAAVGAAKSAYDSARKYLQSNSPSKLFRKGVGQTIGEGMAYGITDTIPMVSEAMDDLDSRVTVPSLEPDIVDYDTPFTDETETMWDVLNGNGLPAVSTQSEPRDITVILQLDRTQLARTVFRLNNEETQRVGLNLAGGAAI